MLVAYLASAIAITLAVTALAFWASLRLVGIKLGFSATLKLAFALVAVQLIAGLLARSLEESLVSVILWLIALFGGFLLWHKLLNRYGGIGIAKSVGAYVIAGILNLIALILVAAGATNIVQTFEITGPVMNPTFKDGDVVLGYRQADPAPNKVVVYAFSNQNKRTVGRIKATPGQTITFDSGYVRPEGIPSTVAAYTLKEGEYYIVGDNRTETIARIVQVDNIIAIVGPTLRKAR